MFKLGASRGGSIRSSTPSKSRSSDAEWTDVTAELGIEPDSDEEEGPDGVVTLYQIV